MRDEADRIGGDPTRAMLLGLARCQLAAEELDSLRENAGAVDWDELLRLTALAGIPGLIARHLHELPVPASIRHKLIALSLATEAQNRRLVGEATKLCAAAHEAGLRLIPLKGVAMHLGPPYGNDFGLRGQCDIDLLATRDQIEAIDALLHERGYGYRGDREFALHHQHHLKYVRQEERPMLVEVHWTPFFVTYGSPERDAEAIARCVTTEAAGMTVAQLDPIDMLLSVSLHLAVHRYRGQLKWLVDVAELARIHGEAIAWDVFWERATLLEATRAVAHVFTLARTLLDAPLPLPPREPRFQRMMHTLSPAHRLIDSHPQPGWAACLLVDMLQRDRLTPSLGRLVHKGAELLERHGKVRIAALSARTSRDHRRR